MIEVRLIENEKRLFCVVDTEFEFPPMTVTVKAGTVGALVAHMEPDTAVNWWASYGITVHENTVIEHSYLDAEKGHVEPMAVIINSHVVCGDLLLRSSLERQSSLRRCFIVAMENFHVIYSTLTFAHAGDAHNLLFMDSAVDQMNAYGNISCLASQVTCFTMKSQVGRNSFGLVMEQAGISSPNLNIIRSDIYDVTVDGSVSTMLAQNATVTRSEIKADAIFSGSVIEDSSIGGTMYHMVNVALAFVDAKTESPHLIMVNHCEKYTEKQALELPFAVMIGDHAKTVRA